MSLDRFLQRTRHVLAAVPRLSSAALRAGTGPRGAFEVLRISEGALRRAATHGAGEPGRANAVRHFLWQSALTARFGLRVARELAAAQEAGSRAAEDSRVDEHNNGVGQEYGAAHPELGDLPLAQVWGRLVPVALEKWESGELVWVRPRS